MVKRQLLQECAELEDHIVLITVTTGFASLLYEEGRTVHSLLGLGADDKNSKKHGTSSSSKYGPRLHRADSLRKPALIIEDEIPMM